MESKCVFAAKFPKAYYCHPLIYASNVVVLLDIF